MADPTDKEELRRVLQRRIVRRELQIAQRGIDAPNEAYEDLAQAKRDLAALEAVENPPVSQTVIDTIPPDQRERAITAAVLNVNQQVAEVKNDVMELKGLFATYQRDDTAERLRRQHETDQYRVELERRLGNVRVGLVVNAVMTVLGWVFRRRF
jgi:hypothetical protein